ncbi:MAG: UDP-N-acetylmuramate--L-alanine ligase [Alphaproteobacteria bacterium]|nr:UDP-N-acetylmuramate--L-alanine ligase [Alphaproteobacteria bacterium]NCQ87466.1 UDP-N-acetylmuramate--L-alanine ligase [Alphaproteobacteria bacterium]NCT06337.1 UDP-N-acetylmuramate--L-alanine ligase [Alphaproteobacteria bacterium]
MRAMPQNIGTLHFVGIGGIGMSGIAEVLHAMGYTVQGSDLSESPNVLRLRQKGIKVYIGQKAENINDATIVIISTAIKDSNPELKAARDKRLTVVRRAEMLAEIMRLKWSVAIAGTHGKTTTTMMVGTMLEEAGYDPTVINGGIVNSYGTNTRLGKGDWIVAEADESDGTFTKLPATVAVVTNIDPEHLDHYGSYDNIKAAFRRFIDNLPFYGFATLCSDHPAVQELIPRLADRRVLTYGFNPQADVQVTNVRNSTEGNTFDVTFAQWLNDGKEETLRDVFLPMLGDHNILNSLAALAIAHEMGVPAATMKTAMKNFSGVKRRFTNTGMSNGITVIDDYGHHPVEIKAVLKAARQAVDKSGKKIIAVMQPHRYSRLHDLFEDFCTCFNDAESVYIGDVYSAGEDPIEGADKDHLVKGIKDRGHKKVQALPTPDDLGMLIAQEAEDGDYVICLGAGDITKWAYALPKQLDDAFAALKKKSA